MAKKYSLAEVKRISKKSGSDFFSRSTMKFFGAAKYSTVLKDGKTYVVVQKSNGNVLYKFNPKTGGLQYSN